MKQKGTLRLIAGLQALAAVTGMLAAGIISVGAEEKAMTAAKTVWSFRELLEADTSFAVEGIYTEDSRELYRDGCGSPLRRLRKQCRLLGKI